ncbi:MAG: septation protein SepH, partial [Acidimicrobiales bacterium]
MQKLHLVGFTTDHEGLILSARRGTRSGGYLLAVDAAVAEAVDAVLAHQDEEPQVREEPAQAPRVESTLPVREIQARLRQGRTVADVAKAAGVDVAWVERFAPPVLAERAQVIARVQRAALKRQRLGQSSHPIGEAVRHNLADRGVLMSPDEFRDAWTAKQIGEGRWAVRCSFPYRGKKKVLRFDFVEADRAVSAADAASGQFGYVTPPPNRKRASARRQSTSEQSGSRPTAKRSTSSSGYRPDSDGGAASSRSAKERQKAAAAMRTAAAKRAADAEKAAAKRVRERAVETARQERAAKAAA